MTKDTYIPINQKPGYINMWHVFHVKTGEEMKACENLTTIANRHNVELDFLVPTTVKFLKKGKQRIKVNKAIFPGYVFANGEMNVKIYNMLKGIPSVYKLLRDRSTFEFLPVPAHEMELLASLMNVYGVIEESVILFEEGEIAVITKGPMASFKGKVVSVNKHKNKLTLAVPFLGEERRVEVGFLFAEPVNPKVDEVGSWRREVFSHLYIG